MVVSLLISFSFFFFKHKTAYDMRISDWSSDVCSSDLKEPDLFDPAFKLRAVAGNYDRRDILAGASLPLVEGKLAVKIDASTRHQKGYIIGVDANGEPDGQRGNGVNRQSARFAMLWTPADDWRVHYSADIRKHPKN